MSKLKKCPFCGREALVGSLNESMDCFCAGCKECDMFFFGDTEKEAVEKWNDRFEYDYFNSIEYKLPKNTDYNKIIAELRMANHYPHNISLFDRAADVIESLKSRPYQMIVQAPTWTLAKKQLPYKEGEYLCICSPRSLGNGDFKLLMFVKNLRSFNKYSFPDENRPGFIEYGKDFEDYEYKVSHWMPIPSLPEESNE